MLGPYMSVSRMPVEITSRALARAMLVAIVLFPTPPFALLTAMTLVTFAMGRFSGRPRFMRAARFGGVPERGRPYCVVTLALIVFFSDAKFGDRDSDLRGTCLCC